MMTAIHKLEAIVILALMLLGAGLAVGWVRDHRRMAVAAAVVATQEKAIAGDRAAIQNRDIADRNFAEQMQQQIAEVKTQAQAVKVIERYLPAPPATPGHAAALPVVATVDRADLPAATLAQLPDAPSYAILTDAQTKAIAKNDLACAAAEHSLLTCAADRADQANELVATRRESAAWQAAAKGGTKWQRLGRALRTVACAGAGAAAGSLVHKQSPAEGSAIGAAAGVAACSLF